MTEINPKHIGTSNELKASVWLLNLGYDVFRNMSPHGSVDLVAIKDGEILLFDVKSASLHKMFERETKGKPSEEFRSAIESAKESEQDIDLPIPSREMEYLTKEFKSVGFHPTSEQVKLGVKFLFVGDNGEFRIVGERRWKKGGAREVVKDPGWDFRGHD